MSIYRKFMLFLVVLLAGQASLIAQQKRLITGSVIDVATKATLPFVTVSLKKKLIGVVTNEEGKFDLYLPAEILADTLLVNYLGYKHFLMDIAEIKDPITIKLEETVVELEEIVVRPLMPEHYIRMATRRIAENYPKAPFQTDAYYREKILENKNLIKSDEGVFKTFYPSYIDTVKNLHQLMIFRRAENAQGIAFMSRQLKKKKQQDSLKTKDGKESESAIDVGKSFGGPAQILKGSDISKKSEDFLDSLEFKNYKYTFAKSSSYNTTELLVIDFVSKGKVNYKRESGRIYLDANSLAIVKIECAGKFVIPAILKPFLFLMSIGVKNPTYVKTSEFQQVNGKWYPKNIQNNIDVILTNNHLFKKDERSLFEIEQFFTVTELKTNDATEVPLEKRYKEETDMDKQVFNDKGLTWEGLNIIKK